MRRVPVVVLLVALLSAGVLASQRQAPIIDIDFVEIDAVVVDKRGQPLHGLQASDFTVKEDGKPVTVTTFREVTGPVPGDPDSARTVVLLLDDAGVLPAGTQTLQIVARGFVQSAAPLDEMPVIRLHTEADDPYGDRLTAESRIDAFRALGTEPARMVAEWTDFFERFDIAKYGSQGAPLHDPCVIAYLIRPDLFTGRHINVEIETKSDLTLGMTVADWWGVTKRPKNAMFMGGIDADGFYALLTERLARL